MGIDFGSGHVGRADLGTAAQQRAAAVHVADHIAGLHPHPLDQRMPSVAGAAIATNPAATAGVLELLAALGIRPDQIKTRGRT